MNYVRQFTAVGFTLFLCLFAVSSVFTQSRSDSQNKQGRLSEIKNKRLIFVEVANKSTKEEIEKFFKDEGQFEIVQNPADAELIYQADFSIESRPTNQTVDRSSSLPRLSSRETLNGDSPINRVDFNRIDVDYRKKTRASVRYKKANGEQTTVWSEETLTITNSKEPGANLQYYRKFGDELFLAKDFLKKLQKIK